MSTAMPPPPCPSRRTGPWLAAGLVVVAAAALFAARDRVAAWAVVQAKSLVADWHPFDAVPIERSADPRPLPSAPAGLRWPAATGADPDAWLAARGTVALLVVRDGRLVDERYFGGFTRASAGHVFSVAKSVVSVLVGIALDEGKITSLDDPVTRWLPELQQLDARFGAVTLRHLLAMRSAIAFDENYASPWSDVARFYLASDLAAQVRTLAVASDPDRRFAYASGNTQLLAMALQRAIGEPLPRYAERRLWKPIGAEFDARWSVDSASAGQVKAFCCLHARAVDLARFGQMVLDRGRVGDRQVVSAGWLHESTAVQQRQGTNDAARRSIEHPSGEHRAFYALGWRRAAGPDGEPAADFWAQGLLGQFVYVAPESTMVIVRLGRHGGDVNWPRWIGELARLNR